MNEPYADSAGATEPTAASGDPPVDSPSAQAANGQEQGDQSKRVNDLMSLANRRLVERDQALAEIEVLKARLEATSQVSAEDEARPSQVELMYPERFASDQPGPDPDDDLMAPPEPPVIVMGVNPARPDHTLRPVAALDPSSPSARFVQDQADIAAMKRQLNAMGAQWYEESGLND